MQSRGQEELCVGLLQVDTVCIRASSDQDEKRANPPRSVRTRVCLELGNLADEQPLQCPVPTLVLLGPLVPAKPQLAELH